MKTIIFHSVCLLLFAICFMGSGMAQGTSKTGALANNSSKSQVNQRINLSDPRTRDAVLRCAAADLGCRYQDLAYPAPGTSVSMTMIPGGLGVEVSLVYSGSLTDMVIIDILKFKSRGYML